MYNKISTNVVLPRHQTKGAESRKKELQQQKRRQNGDNKGENVQGQNMKGRIHKRKKCFGQV